MNGNIGMIDLNTHQASHQRRSYLAHLQPTAKTYALIMIALQVAAILSTYQLFLINIQGIFISIYTIIAYAVVLLCGVIYLMYAAYIDRFSIFFIIMCAVQISSAAWSPDVRLLVREMLYTIPFIAIYLSTLILAARNPNAPRNLLWIFSMAAVPNSILIITFITFPEMENAFLSSRLSGLFINPNSLASISAGEVGVSALDHLKAGAFFPNGNMAGVFTEIAFYSGLAAASGRAGRARKLILATHYIAILATGSKSAMGLALIIPVLAYFLTKSLHKKVSRSNIIALAVAVPVVFVGYAVVTGFFISDSLASDGRINFLRRLIIWDFALDKFSEHPMGGLGYGGWVAAFKGYGDSWRHIGINGDMPPHNTLIVLWAQSGIFAPIFALAAILTIFIRAVRCIDHYGALYSGSCLAAIVALVAHSMTENYTYFSEPHFQAPCAILFAWVTYRSGLIRST